MTHSIFARATQSKRPLLIQLADLLNGNARRRRQLKAKAQHALLCGKRPALVRAEVALQHHIAGNSQLQARIEQTRAQARQRRDWHRNP